jgi:pimeloyl-ACP methyl ester carboxylesterase
MGFGDPDRVQPFFQADAGAYLMLDGIRAVRAFLRSAGEPQTEHTFLAGYSQGGHAAFAAADYRERYAPETEIDGIIGYGPTTDMHALLREFVVVGPIVAYSFRERYGAERFDPALMLQDRWLPTLDEDVTRQCIGGIQSYYPWGPRDLYRREFADALENRTVGRHFPDIDRILREHTVGLSGHGVPALILQGTDDIVVYPDSQTEFVTRLREAGSDVRYLIYRNERHDVRQAAYFDVLEWMRTQS